MLRQRSNAHGGRPERMAATMSSAHALGVRWLVSTSMS
jgi:hypothetical protein